MTLRRQEEHALSLISNHLAVNVKVHDDGTANSLYDLRVGERSAPEIAIECVSAVDPVAIATEKAGPAQGKFRVESNHCWHIVLKNHANVKRVRTFLSTRLFQIEALFDQLHCNAIHLPTRVNLRTRSEALCEAEKIGVASFIRYQGTVSGEAYFSLEGGGGSVNYGGYGIGKWISDFLSHESKKDVLGKLAKSNAKRNDVFVHLSWYAPWHVYSYFLYPSDAVPEPPKLPDPINCVWVHSHQKCLLWNGREWEKLLE